MRNPCRQFCLCRVEKSSTTSYGPSPAPPPRCEQQISPLPTWWDLCRGSSMLAICIQFVCVNEQKWVVSMHYTLKHTTWVQLRDTCCYVVAVCPCCPSLCPHTWRLSHQFLLMVSCDNAPQTLPADLLWWIEAADFAVVREYDICHPIEDTTFSKSGKCTVVTHPRCELGPHVLALSSWTSSRSNTFRNLFEYYSGMRRHAVSDPAKNIRCTSSSLSKKGNQNSAGHPMGVLRLSAMGWRWVFCVWVQWVEGGCSTFECNGLKVTINLHAHRTTYFDDVRPKWESDQKVRPTSSNLHDDAVVASLCQVDTAVMLHPKPTQWAWICECESCAWVSEWVTNLFLFLL